MDKKGTAVKENDPGTQNSLNFARQLKQKLKTKLR